MKKGFYKTALIVLLIAISYSSIANDNDSLLSYNELQFHSDSEKEYFGKALKTDEITFDFMLLSEFEIDKDSRDIYKARVNSTIERIKKSNSFNKPPKKQIKYIFTQIHEEYFDHYVDTALFHDIFTSKKFNCLSATMLYSWILNKLNIPNEIKYNDMHVFLVAYPNTEVIIVETTDVNFRVSNFENYIKSLREAKLISQEVYNSVQPKKVFIKHITKSKDGDLRNLCGMQYNNQAQFHIQDEEIKECLENLKKAYFLVDLEHIEKQIGACYGEMFNGLNFNNPQKIELLATLYKFKDKSTSDDFFINNFNAYSQLLTRYEITTEQYDKQSDEFFNSVSDSLSHILKKEYYLFKAYHNHTARRYKEAFNDSKNLLKISPNDYRAKQILLSSIEQIDKFNNEEEIISLLNNLFIDIPDLKSDEVLAVAYLGLQLYQIEDIISEHDTLKAKDKIQEFMDQTDVSNLNEQSRTVVAHFYENVAEKFYYLKDYKFCLKLVKKGLEVNPENYNLKKKEKALSSMF